jgi:hypothetical protein
MMKWVASAIMIGSLIASVEISYSAERNPGQVEYDNLIRKEQAFIDEARRKDGFPPASDIIGTALLCGKLATRRLQNQTSAYRWCKAPLAKERRRLERCPAVAT